MTIKPLAPHQQRVVAERDELQERLNKLNAFLTTFAFSQVPPEEQVRLNTQAGVMQQLLDILNERIAAF